MSAIAQKGGVLLGKKSDSITGYESPARSKQLPQTLQLEEKYAKNGWVVIKGSGQTKETILQYINKGVGISPAVTLDPGLFVELLSRSNHSTLTNEKTLYLHPIYCQWCVFLLAGEVFVTV